MHGNFLCLAFSLLLSSLDVFHPGHEKEQEESGQKEEKEGKEEQRKGKEREIKSAAPGLPAWSPTAVLPRLKPA